MGRISQRIRKQNIGAKELWENHRRLQQRHAQQQKPQTRIKKQQQLHQDSSLYQDQNQLRPLLIPEIILHVGNFLDSYSALQCLRVCQQWYSLLLPMVWSSVEVVFGSFFLHFVHPRGIVKDPHVFLKHTHLIQQLSLASTDTFDFPLLQEQPDQQQNETEERLQNLPRQFQWGPAHRVEVGQDPPRHQHFTIHCPNLSTLILPLHWNPHEKERKTPELIAARESALIDLIRRHQHSLEVLELGTDIFSEELLEVLMGCPRLRRLEQEEWFIEPKWILRQYEQIWSLRLNTLRLIQPDYIGDRIEMEGLGSFAAAGIAIDNNISSWGKQLDSSSECSKPRSVETTQLKDLEFKWHSNWSGFHGIALKMIINSPELTRLKWDFYSAEEDESPSTGPLARLVRAMSSSSSSSPSLPPSSSSSSSSSPKIGTWSQLKTLAVIGADFEVKDFETLVRVLPVLTDLELELTNFDDCFLQLLQTVDQGRYRSTLSELRFKKCDGVTGAIVHEILCQFSGLRVFKAEMIRHSDLLQDAQDHDGVMRPWVCLGLKELSLYFGHTSSDESNTTQESTPATFSVLTSAFNSIRTTITAATTTSPPPPPPPQSPATTVPPTFESLIFPRLSTFEQLEVLDMNTTDVILRHRNVRMDLKHDLDQLWTLKRLRILNGSVFKPRVFYWGEDEAHWVLDHWPRLETLDYIGLTDGARSILEDEGGLDCRNCIRKMQ
ncbi:hypothetical protein BGZ83_010566 [Gryganskiella cystojenkinii]|nr:hypothetical protein BGZ83_010566 [Gryganskiella cystojenkinii]